MIRKIVLAVIVAVVVTLACILLGNLLQALEVKVAVTVGEFLEHYAGVFGVLAGLWHYFTGSPTLPRS